MTNDININDDKTVKSVRGWSFTISEIQLCMVYKQCLNSAMNTSLRRTTYIIGKAELGLIHITPACGTRKHLASNMWIMIQLNIDNGISRNSYMIMDSVKNGDAWT